MDQPAGLPSIAGATALAKKIPESKDMKIKARKLNEALTATLLPGFALHVVIVSGLLLRHNEPGLFRAIFPLFWVLALLVAADLFVSAYRRREALTGGRIVALQSVPPLGAAGTLWVTGLILFPAVCVIAMLCFRRIVPPIGMVLVCLYSIGLYSVFASPKGIAQMMPFAIPTLAVATVVLLRLRSHTYFFGVTAAAVLAFVLSSDSQTDSAVVLVLLGLIILAIFFVYEVATEKSAYSDFLRFAACGIVVFAILSIEFKAFSLSPVPAFLLAAAIFSAYAGALRLRSGGAASCVYLSWIAILLAASVRPLWGDPGIFLFATGALFVLSVARKNGFARLLSGCIAALGMLKAASELIDRSAAIGRETASQGGGLPEGFPASYGWVVAFALAAILIAQYRHPKAGLAWWRGLIHARRAAVVRQIFRSVSKKLKDVPLVGWLYGLFETARTYMRYAKDDGTDIDHYDILQIGAFVILAISTAAFLRPYFALGFTGASLANAGYWAGVLSTIAGWALWGTALALWGNRRPSLFHSFLAFAFFCVPAATEIVGPVQVSRPSREVQWIVIVLLWASPVFLIGLLPKRRAGK